MIEPRKIAINWSNCAHGWKNFSSPHGHSVIIFVKYNVFFILMSARVIKRFLKFQKWIKCRRRLSSSVLQQNKAQCAARPVLGRFNSTKFTCLSTRVWLLKKLFFDKGCDALRLNSQSAIAIFNYRILIMIFFIILNGQKCSETSSS